MRKPYLFDRTSVALKTQKNRRPLFEKLPQVQRNIFSEFLRRINQQFQITKYVLVGAMSIVFEIQTRNARRGQRS